MRFAQQQSFLNFKLINQSKAIQCDFWLIQNCSLHSMKLLLSTWKFIIKWKLSFLQTHFLHHYSSNLQCSSKLWFSFIHILLSNFSLQNGKMNKSFFLPNSFEHFLASSLQPMLIPFVRCHCMSTSPAQCSCLKRPL